MITWQYLQAYVGKGSAAQHVLAAQVLNRNGDDGWEFTGHVTEDEFGYHYLMKRPINRDVHEIAGVVRLEDDTLVATHYPVVDLNHFDTAISLRNNACAICGAEGNHNGEPHGEVTGDMLGRQDIIDYLNGRGFRNWYNF